MWAIAPSKSKSGKAMLLGNPHQPWAALYWEAQVTVPGKLNFYGGTFVGSPVLTTGFNEHLGWTHTVDYPDLDDIYTLKMDPAKPDHYLFDGQSRPLQKVEIEVGGEKRTYWDSHLGPVVHRTRDTAFAMKSATMSAWAYADEWYALSKTKNWKEFHEVIRRNQLPMFNVTYADVDGNIFYLWNGMVPKRVDDGTDYRFEVPGDGDKYVWSTLHTTDELPQLLNPKGGYVQNCNAPPWWTSLRDPLDPKKFPSYFEPGRALSMRTMMSLEMLESQPKFSLEDVQRLKFNNRMLLASRVKPDLLAAIRTTASNSPDLMNAAKILEAWDNTTAHASRGGVLFMRFWETYSKEVTQPYAKPWDAKDPLNTPSGLSFPATALNHLEAAVKYTRQNYGSEDVAWGDVYRIRLHDVDLPSDGADGIYGVFHVVTYQDAPDHKRVANGGDGWIMTVEFGKPLKAYSLLAYGETSDPKSKHSTDQAKLFSDHQFKPVWFYERDLNAHVERKYRPE